MQSRPHAETPHTGTQPSQNEVEQATCSDPQPVLERIRKILHASQIDVEIHILACNGNVQPASNDLAGVSSAIPAPILSLDFTGPDLPLFTARNGELLLALEHLATQLLRLTPEQHDRVSFDAGGFKAARHRQLQQQAASAIASVRSTGSPYAFAPMSSRERRLLHLALASSNLPTASAGEGPRRHVVLYPEGFESPASPAAPPPADRARALRNAFRVR